MAGGYPEGQPLPAGRSYHYVQVVAPPGAGNTYTFTVQSESEVLVRCIRARLAADANVASRVVTVRYLDSGGNELATIEVNVPVTANNARNYTFATSMGSALTGGASNPSYLMPLPDVHLQPGLSVKIDVQNIQVGDTLTGIALWLQHFHLDYGQPGEG